MHDHNEGGCSALTSLDPLETKGNSLRVEDGYDWPEAMARKPLRGVHAKYHGRRAVIIRAFLDSGEPALTKRAERMRFCSACPHVRVASSGAPSLVLGRCRDRLCPLCSDLRGRQCATKLAVLIKRMNAPRFVTLTLKNSASPLGDQVDRLFDAFRKLRDTKWWKSHVSGGCYSLEVTFNARERTWHPHLHLVVDGEYLPQKLLATAWEEATGDSRIVWVEAVHDAERAAKYVAAYLNTPPDVHLWGREAIVDYAVAMHGRRVLHCFGTLHAASIDAAKEKEAPPESRYVCTVKELVEKAISGNRSAVEACEYLVRMGGFWSAVASPLLSFPTHNGPPVTDVERCRFGRLCEAAFKDELPPPRPPPPDDIDAGPMLWESAGRKL